MAWQVFWIFFKLGFTSFGGPVAHLGYFREEFVHKRRWFSDQSYADLVALCQFLPGPASSQVGLSIGLSRGGYSGAFMAWLGFTLPSALALILVALAYQNFSESLPNGILSGLKIVAVAVVAQAVWGMANSLCQGKLKMTLMILSACVVLLFPTALTMILLIVAAGLFGYFTLQSESNTSPESLNIPIGSVASRVWMLLFWLLLLGLPLSVALFPNTYLAVIDVFYRVGSLVFGGGHVVLPLLEAETVASGWVSPEAFLAGYGVAQAVPGPLFTFSAFLGASMQEGIGSILLGLTALAAIFLPSFLLVFAVLPYWENLRKSQKAQSALAGINAAVVGVLLAAFYDPVFTSGIKEVEHFAFALITFAALVFWKLPPWLVVLLSAIAGGLLLS